MRRNFSMAMILSALAVLLAFGGANEAATAAQATIAATPPPTLPATKAVTKAATQSATVTATVAATATSQVETRDATLPAPGTPALISTREAGVSTPQAVEFNKAPAPTAGSLGVTLSDSDPVVVRSTFPDGPAEKGGLEPGDELLKLNGKVIESRDVLFNQIVSSKAGDTLTFTVNRDGAEQEITVTAKTRREVYCPVPEAKLTEGAAIIKGALDSDKNWTLTGDTTEGVDKVIGDGKLTFKVKTPSEDWLALVNLRGKAVLEYAVSVEITQTGSAAAGLLLNTTRNNSYNVQFLPNGSWQMSAIVEGSDSPGGLSFGETLLNAQATKTGSVTNTVRVVTDGSDMFFYFNGKFACGVPLFIFADPPLDAGNIGLYAVVGADKSGQSTVSFSKFELVEITK